MLKYGILLQGFLEKERMKNMKKTVSLLLALLLTFSLVACDSEDTPGEENISSAITRTVLIDEADVKIVALSLAEKTMVGPELKLQIENKTDKTLVFQSSDTAVNHYMVGSVMSVEVEAGQKEKCSMILSNTDIQACGITTIASIEVAFRIFDAENWKQYLNTNTVTLETLAAKGFTYTFQHEGVTAYEENGVKIVVKEPVRTGGAQIYICNGIEKKICVEVTECLIGGVKIDPMFYEEVPAGKHIVTEVIFAEEILEENNITEVTDVSVVFQIRDENGEVIANTETILLKTE